jgi:hypothetical protein
MKNLVTVLQKFLAIFVAKNPNMTKGYKTIERILS